MGEKPDARMRKTAKHHGISLESQRAQQLSDEDFVYYDYIYAMDRSVERDALLMARRKGCEDKVVRFSRYDPDPHTFEVPDPYFSDNFEAVYTIVDRTCRAILEALVRQYRLVPAT